MINKFIKNIEKILNIYIYISNRKNLAHLLTITLLIIPFVTNQVLADDDSKKCVVYRNGKLMYNPDNPKIHCTTLQLLDDFWSDHDVNVPNPDKKPEDFAEILTMEEIVSNGNTTCKNPTIQNVTFPSKTVSEGVKITGQCDEGYSGSITAVCSADGNWNISGTCDKDVFTDVDCGKGTLTGDKANGYCTYAYTGSQQTFSATTDTSATIFLKVLGAQGGYGKSMGAFGGYSYGSLTLDSGTTDLYVFVGGMGQTATKKGEIGAGGWNGGGNCYRAVVYDCGGGGGATDIRKGGTELTDRIIVAGGGGGSGYRAGGSGGGGSNDGGNGNGNSGYVTGGTGGTLVGPGSGGTIIKTDCPDPKPGKNGDGPNGGDTDSEIPESTSCYSAGAGGGGYYGGGSGPITGSGTGGGGGSGYVDGVNGGNGSNNIRAGDGRARICWGSYANLSGCI